MGNHILWVLKNTIQLLKILKLPEDITDFLEKPYRIQEAMSRIPNTAKTSHGEFL